MKDVARGVYKKIVLKDKKSNGARPVWRYPVDCAWYFQLMRLIAPMCQSDFRETLMFGQAHLGPIGSQRPKKTPQAAMNARNGKCAAVTGV